MLNSHCNQNDRLHKKEKPEKDVRCMVRYGNSVMDDIGEASIRIGKKSHKLHCKVKYSSTITKHIGTYRGVSVINRDMLQSEYYGNVKINVNMMYVSRQIVKKLLLSKLDSCDGIPLSVDCPFGQSGLTNISRPAVLRVYYGKDLKITSSKTCERITYGSTEPSGSLAMDPRRFTTKSMSVEMFEFGICLVEYVKKKFNSKHKSTKILDVEFNHCTILIYNVHTTNINNKLSYHCDCIYDHNGEFCIKTNTQGKDTPVIVYTIGDSRSISFRKRTICNTKSKWKVLKTPVKTFKLHNNSIFVLHPDDELPMQRCLGENLSQFQHGNVNVKKGLLSIGLVFRNVTKYLKYDIDSSKLILPPKYNNHNIQCLLKFDDAFLNEKKLLA